MWMFASGFFFLREKGRPIFFLLFYAAFWRLVCWLTDWLTWKIPKEWYGMNEFLFSSMFEHFNDDKRLLDDSKRFKKSTIYLNLNTWFEMQTLFGMLFFTAADLDYYYCKVESFFLFSYWLSDSFCYGNVGLLWLNE